MSTNGNGGANDRRRRRPTARPATSTTRCASRSSASATARTRSCRASTTTATPTRPRPVPGLMHVDLGGYHVRDIEFTCAFDIDATKVGKDLGEAIWAEPNNTIKFTEAPAHARRARLPRHDPRRPRQVPRARRSRRRPARPPTSSRSSRRRTPTSSSPTCPVGSEQATKWYVEQVLEAGCALRQLHPGLHRARGLLEQALQEGRPADRRRRHQVAGRRDDHAPRAGPPLPRARRDAAAHLAAQRRRQHGLLQHARARAPGVQEDLQDQRRDLDRRRRAAGRRRPRRPLGLRAVADRPQVGPHPPRGRGLRRRAAHRRAQARGVGLAELGGHRHRRRAPAASWRSTTASAASSTGRARTS